jgi:hypothetical protein
MYFVNEKPFNDLIDAIQHCKTRPSTVLTDSKGVVLMKHHKVSFSMFQDIELAKKVLKRQLSEIHEMN